MKFEEFLMQPRTEDQRRRAALEEEVQGLQERLDGEVKLNRVLRTAMRGPVFSTQIPSLTSLPPKVQVILSELAKVEEEIIWLEMKVGRLRINLNQEKKLNKELELNLLHNNQHYNHHHHHHPNLSFTIQKKHHHLQTPTSTGYELDDSISTLSSSSPRNYIVSRRTRSNRRYESMDETRRLSVSSVSEEGSSSSSTSKLFSSTRFNEEIGERSWRRAENIISLPICSSSSRTSSRRIDKPNRISEEILNSLISIFLNLNYKPALMTTPLDETDRRRREELTTSTKHQTGGVSCISSTGLSTLNCKARTHFNNNKQTTTGSGGGVDDDLSYTTSIGGRTDNICYRVIQITRRSLRKGYLPNHFTSTRRLRTLLQKLCSVDLTFLTYKQKLAFWINIYNACIMNAYLQHGLPSTQERMLSLMNKAALNVGGIVLNALAIEHYILRHPHDLEESDPTDEKEILLRHAYGLKYPEPNVTFALCRGNWSSPALRVYTPDEVINQLERAKVEYLEGSVGVTSSKRKMILIPKLLVWYMHDFAEDMESLVEWVYSQLPPKGTLKRRIMECLLNNGETKSFQGNKVEVVPYQYEFRYLVMCHEQNK